MCFFVIKVEVDVVVVDICVCGRLIVGFDIGSNLFSFCDLIIGEIIGFDVDIVGEVVCDIFGVLLYVEYWILLVVEWVIVL